MSSTSAERVPDPMLTAQFWFYRISSYLLLNLIDDPAWLALIFC